MSSIKMSSITMYIIVNNDLAMGKGKIIAQCCHGVCDVIRQLHTEKNDEIYRSWLKNGQKKIVLKATQKQLIALLDEFNIFKSNGSTSNGSSSNKNIWCHIWCHAVYDAGLTQIPENSLTCVVFRPLAPDQIPNIIHSLKLL